MDATVSGDWVIRHGAGPEKLLPELEAILRRECKLGVRLRLVREDRKVVLSPIIGIPARISVDLIGEMPLVILAGFGAVRGEGT